MGKTHATRILYFFVAIFIVTNLGFYKTYLIHFPTFEGFAWIYHVHGMLAMAWILMLITQAYLIRAKKYDLHRFIGKLSYVIMPLLLLSIFFVAKESYFKKIQAGIPQAKALADLTNGGTIIDIFALGIMYVLAIIYKKNVGYHLRFMAGTGLAILGPGLGRFVFAFLELPIPLALLTMLFCTTVVGIVWLIVDLKNKKSAFPMGIYVVIALSMNVMGANATSAWWQGFAKWWVETMY